MDRRRVSTEDIKTEQGEGDEMKLTGEMIVKAMEAKKARKEAEYRQLEWVRRYSPGMTTKYNTEAIAAELVSLGYPEKGYPSFVLMAKLSEKHKLRGQA